MQAVVYGPEGGYASARTLVSGAQWAQVTYPNDFTGAMSQAAGNYTIIWKDMTGRDITCDGFTAGP